MRAPMDQRAALKKASQGFEELFLTQFLKAARSGQLAQDIMGGQGVDQMRDLFDAEVAKVASTQSHLGIAAAVERQFSPMIRQKE